MSNEESRDPTPLLIDIATPAFHHEPPDVLAIYCSDGRFGHQCEHFIEQHLGAPRYDRFVVPGGAAWIVLDWFTFKEFDVSRESLTLLVELHHLQRILVIAHEDCGFYRQHNPSLKPDEICLKEHDDLRTAREVLLKWFPGVEVDLYYAGIKGTSVTFEKVE